MPVEYKGNLHSSNKAYTNKLFDHSPGKESQWAQWTALIGKEMQRPVLTAETPYWNSAQMSWYQGEGKGQCLKLELAAWERPWYTSTGQLTPEYIQCLPGLHPLLIHTESVFFIPCIPWGALQTHVQQERKPRMLIKKDTLSKLIKIRKRDTFLCWTL